jgi:hypothetical protein
MAASRAGAWWVLALLLLTNVASTLSDPFFDRVSGQWQQGNLEGEADPPPVWRIPARIKTLSYTPVLLAMAVVVPSESLPALPLLASPPFVPPRG